jgi:hypothetical protein
MIEYIGNYNFKINTAWVNKMNSTTGEIRPNGRMVATDSVNKQLSDWSNAGYIDASSVQWELFHDWDFEEKLDFDSIDFCQGKQITWWISKVKPGKCFPMHYDTIKEDLVNPKRYWIALEDYKWGHVFIVGNRVVRDYRAGDVFLFDNSIHGAANVGLETKFSLQLLVSDLN